MKKNPISQAGLERAILKAINAHYKGSPLPETVIVAISPSLSVRVLGTYSDYSRKGVNPDWNIEEIDTDDLSTNIAETAAVYFDPCYCDTESKERIRHAVSAILIDTSEEHQMPCDIPIGEDEAVGVGSLELPRIVSCWQHPTEGLITFIIEGYGAVDFDDPMFTISDLKGILSGLLQEPRITLTN